MNRTGDDFIQSIFALSWSQVTRSWTIMTSHFWGFHWSHCLDRPVAWSLSLMSLKNKLRNFAERWCAALWLQPFCSQVCIGVCCQQTEWWWKSGHSYRQQAGRVSKQEHRENIHNSQRSSSFSRAEQQWRLTNRGFNLHTPTTISVCKKINEVEDANWILQTDSETENKCGCSGFFRGSESRTRSELGKVAKRYKNQMFKFIVYSISCDACNSASTVRWSSANAYKCIQALNSATVKWSHSAKLASCHWVVWLSWQEYLLKRGMKMQHHWQTDGPAARNAFKSCQRGWAWLDWNYSNLSLFSEGNIK